MWKNIGLEHCLSFINCQLGPQGKANLFEPSIKPAVTISRMSGSGGRTVASKLADYLQARAPAHCQWTVFDRNLMEKVLEEHHLDKRIAAFMPEGHKPMLTDTVEELLGLHPSSWTLVQQTAATILHLAQLGYVILVGRGANIITRKMENVFHVRLVGSLEKRTTRVQKLYDIDAPTALAIIKKEDKGRRRYLKDQFHKDIDDPLLYHMIINTDRIRYEDAARLIGDTVIHRFGLDFRAEPAVA